MFFRYRFETTAQQWRLQYNKRLKKGLELFGLVTAQTGTSGVGGYLFRFELNVDGLICPGHVSVITGIEPYELLVKYGRPCVITGFETQDIVEGVSCLLMLLGRAISG